MPGSRTAAYRRRSRFGLRALLIGMAGGTNHNCFLMLGTESGDAGSRGVETEIDQHVSLFKYRAEIVALIQIAMGGEIVPSGPDMQSGSSRTCPRIVAWRQLGVGNRW